MTTRRSGVKAVLYLEQSHTCSWCGKSIGLDANEYGDCIDLCLDPESYIEAKEIALSFSNRYKHDALILRDPESNELIVAAGTYCLENIIGASGTFFTICSSLFIEPTASVPCSANFIEAFEYFKRILPNATRRLMLSVYNEGRCWSIEEETPELLPEWDES